MDEKKNYSSSAKEIVNEILTATQEADRREAENINQMLIYIVEKMKSLFPKN